MKKLLSCIVTVMVILSTSLYSVISIHAVDEYPDTPSLDSADCPVIILEEGKSYYLQYKDSADADEENSEAELRDYYLVWRSINEKPASIYESYIYEDSQTKQEISMLYIQSNFAYVKKENALTKYIGDNPFITVVGDDIEIGLFGLFSEIDDEGAENEDSAVVQNTRYRDVMVSLDIEDIYQIEDYEPEIPREFALHAGQTMIIEKNTTVNPDTRKERIAGFPEVTVSPLTVGSYGTVNDIEITDDLIEPFNQMEGAGVTILNKGDRAEIKCDTGSLLVSLAELNIPYYDITYPFKDVPETMWYHSAVYKASRKSLMTGTSITEFKPNSNLTRGMAATVLYRMAGSPAVSGSCGFKDVPDGMYYSDPVAWAVQTGVITGYTEGDKTDTFGPDDAVTREQICTMVYRFLTNVAGIDTSEQADLDAFQDKDQVSEYAVEAVKYCAAKGIISGAENGTKLYPMNAASRAESAKILVNTSMLS